MGSRVGGGVEHLNKVCRKRNSKLEALVEGAFFSHSNLLAVMAKTNLQHITRFSQLFLTNLLTNIQKNLYTTVPSPVPVPRITVYRLQVYPVCI